MIVNRVWQWHFGDGLVRSESDFGTHGEKPSHPELLDWLADWFIKEGWSIKKLNRLILHSSVYRQDTQYSILSTQYSEIDPDNRLLAKFPYRRLDVEAIRDSILAVSGQMNPEMGGPGVFLPIPKEALEGNSDPKTVWKPSDERAASRRTIYAVIKCSLTNPLLETLDLCDTARSSAKRLTTTVAPQALTLFNGEFVNQQAKHFAVRLEREAGADEAKQIELAYRLTLCRQPTEREMGLMREFLKKSGGGREARADEPGDVQFERVCIFGLTMADREDNWKFEDVLRIAPNCGRFPDRKRLSSRWYLPWRICCRVRVESSGSEMVTQERIQ